MGSERGRNHGSRDRVPGVFFRAMAGVYLEARPEVPREAVVKRLTARLLDQGIEYHVRTVRRQLLGVVDSVPPEVEAELRRMIRDDLGLDDEAVENKIAAKGIEVPPELRRSMYVPIDRAERLTRLWLHANPGKSKRSLAQKLSADLSSRGVVLSTDSLQSQLAGKGYLVRRELLEVLASYLLPPGSGSVEDAEHRAAELNERIDESIEGRALVEANRFQQLCRIWQLSHREASSRRLAHLLKDRLGDRGLDVGIHHLQRSIAGKTPRVRADLLQAMEEIMAESSKAKDLPVEATVEPVRSVDLAWVRCEPISVLAGNWLVANPGASMRQLALRVAQTVRKLGYDSSHNTIQPILGGWKKKTRGYVYRAVLRQFPGREDEEIPPEHIVGPVASPEVEPTHEAARKASSLDAFVADARRRLPRSKSQSFAKLAAARAEKLYGVPSEEVERMITEDEELPTPRLRPDEAWTSDTRPGVFSEAFESR
ncbi:MAG: hypothetical protein HYV07_19090 [Deltaproteobacteria bacterium]|nr:hypothetical protein [Deltaproteobacteria bacterium]